MTKPPTASPGFYACYLTWAWALLLTLPSTDHCLPNHPAHLFPSVLLPFLGGVGACSPIYPILSMALTGQQLQLSQRLNLCRAGPAVGQMHAGVRRQGLQWGWHMRVHKGRACSSKGSSPLFVSPPPALLLLKTCAQAPWAHGQQRVVSHSPGLPGALGLSSPKPGGQPATALTRQCPLPAGSSSQQDREAQSPLPGSCPLRCLSPPTHPCPDWPRSPSLPAAVAQGSAMLSQVARFHPLLCVARPGSLILLQAMCAAGVQYHIWSWLCPSSLPAPAVGVSTCNVPKRQAHFMGEDTRLTGWTATF